MYYEVVRVPVTRWIFTKQLFIFPLLVRRVPELQRFFFARYFYDVSQAALLVARVGVVLAARWLPALMLIVPYVRDARCTGPKRWQRLFPWPAPPHRTQALDSDRLPGVG